MAIVPIKTEFDDGQRWWYCPICRAGWRQYKNYPDDWASDKARMCINHHITEKREGEKK